MKLVVGLGDSRRVEHSVKAALGFLVTGTVGADLAVDDDMRHVDAARLELPRHALGDGTQSELSHGEIVELGAAA
jgi:hypothetical protein